ncbi:DUF4219 domain-containing protein/UBN2 domain-containing protein, partial [Cephalotus follicularis]
ICHAMH